MPPPDHPGRAERRRPRRPEAHVPQRRQARFKRARILNRVLAPYQLSMHEDLSGTRYVVGDRKGAQEVVRDLDELWTAADRLAHVPVDPLDERLLATLEGSSADR